MNMHGMSFTISDWTEHRSDYKPGNVDGWARVDAVVNDGEAEGEVRYVLAKDLDWTAVIKYRVVAVPL